jgi:hypothetical protein
VQYSTAGVVQYTYSIAGLVDGLKFNPVAGTVWALQNNDGNAMLSIINPTTHTVTGPLSYASPPYVRGSLSARGYDDVAFLNGNVCLSYTNPVNLDDPVLQVLNQGNNPTGRLTTKSILTAQDVNPNFTAPGPNTPDIDSLKSTPNGELVLTSEGGAAGPGLPPPPATAGVVSLIANPDTSLQTVTNYLVEDSGVNVSALDDIIFPGAKAGWLFVASTTGTTGNTVYKLWLTGLNPDAPIAAIGSLDEVAVLDLVANPGAPGFATANVGTALLSDITGVHGMDFIAAPERSTWAMMLLGFAGLGLIGYRASAKRREALVG